MDRKEFSRAIAEWWITDREKEWGFRNYDKNLCHYICKNVPKNPRVFIYRAPYDGNSIHAPAISNVVALRVY